MKRNTWLAALLCAAVSAQSGVIHALTTTGSMDDVPGSFARGATLAAKCPKPQGNSASAPQPMHVEMVLVDAWRRPSGDVEAITHVIPADDGVRATNTTRGFSSDADTEGRPSVTSRTLCAADLADSSTYHTGFGDGYPEIFPGTTEFSLSTATMRLLRTTGEAPLDYIQYEFQSANLLDLGIEEKYTRASYTYPLPVGYSCGDWMTPQSPCLPLVCTLTSLPSCFT